MSRFACLVAAAISLPLSPLLAQKTPLAVDLVGFGFTRPIDLQVPKGDSARLFIAEQAGLIRIIKSGTLVPAPFLDIRSKTFGSGERGLLGLAFHPNYAQNGYFFVYYTDRSGRSVVERYSVSTNNPDLADPNSAKLVFGPESQPYSNHNGGSLFFGPKGYLHLSLGDGGSGGDPGCRAQNGQSFLGKLLRLDIDTTAPYAIPADNPFRNNSNVRDEIAHLGLRNAWRCSYDRVTGELYLGDVGQNAREEISVAPAGKLGLNFGWKIMEGDLCYGTFNCASGIPTCNSPALTNPVHAYPRNEGRSVTGGFVYRGCAIPDLKGTYFFADYQDRKIWSFRYANGKVTEFTDRRSELVPLNSTRSVGRISSFGEDDAGEIYICDYSDGEIWKIIPRLLPPVKDLGFGKAGAQGVPVFDACGLLYQGNKAVFTLTSAAPQTLAILVLSTTNMPVSVLGGTLVPWPPLPIITFPTDTKGAVDFEVPGGSPGTSYAQFLVFDAKATQNFAFSNALQVDFR